MREMSNIIKYLPDGVYRIEYNESQRAFHLDKGQHLGGTFDWVTVCVMAEDMCNAFLDYMENKYKIRLPKLLIVQKELKQFLEKNYITSN
jgi:hypothetical protein